jgi:hypothetical protein
MLERLIGLVTGQQALSERALANRQLIHRTSNGLCSVFPSDVLGRKPWRSLAVYTVGQRLISGKKPVRNKKIKISDPK